MKYIVDILLALILIRLFFPGIFQVRVYHFNSNQQPHENQTEEKIRVTKLPQEKSGGEKEAGEYIDYEEIK